MDEQPRLTDLIPQRISTFLVLTLAAVTCIVALEVLYSWMPTLAAMTTDGRVAAIDLDGEGSLAVWFSSVTLLAAAAVTLVIYFVRRHRVDDYQGRYRIWLVAAACWILMSLDETASLHEGFKELMSHVTGNRLLGDGSLWWAIPYLFLLGTVGSRLLLDMRRCFLASGALILAAACYLVGVTTQLQWILPQSGAEGVMVEEGAEMLGNVLLLLALGLYARYVILDAEGLLLRIEDLEGGGIDRVSVWDAQRAAAADEWIKASAPHLAAQPVVKRRERLFGKKRLEVPVAAVASALAAETASDPILAPDPAQRKLTKQEKKALRKRLIQDRMERERKLNKAWK